MIRSFSGGWLAAYWLCVVIMTISLAYLFSFSFLSHTRHANVSLVMASYEGAQRGANKVPLKARLAQPPRKLTTRNHGRQLDNNNFASALIQIWPSCHSNLWTSRSGGSNGSGSGTESGKSISLWTKHHICLLACLRARWLLPAFLSLRLGLLSTSSCAITRLAKKWISQPSWFKQVARLVSSRLVS